MLPLSLGRREAAAPIRLLVLGAHSDDGEIGCGVAPTLASLIVARAIQGMGAALLIPGSLSLISAAYPEETRGAAIGTWSAASAITAAAGPVAGGWLVTHASWRWLFFFNVPVAAVVLS